MPETLTKPKRIQRKRTKGWRMPENAVSVTRPGIFGNPFKVGEGGDAAWAVREFRVWLIGKTANRWPHLTERRERLLRELPRLRGKDLACFCSETAEHCHADVLIELANT